MEESSTISLDQFREQAKSLNMAHQNIDKILDDICRKKWEQEVIEKRGRPHSVNWVFGMGQDIQALKPDPNKLTTQYDQDEDDEPVSVLLVLNV